MTSLLEALLPAVTIERFLNESWPENLVVAHGERGRFFWLEDAPELRSIDDYLDFIAGSSASAHLALGEHQDEHSSFVIRAADVPGMLADRTSFIVGGAEAYSPGLRKWLEHLRGELSLTPMAEARNIVYGSKRGAGTAWHWDAGANFVVQLQGTKRWRVSENTILPQPPDRYAVTMTGISGRLRPYLRADPPIEGPSTWQSVELRPGSVMFLPAGWWHSTSSVGTSLALNFTFGQPDYARVLARYLVQRLRYDPRWRKLAQPSKQASVFDELITEAAAHLRACTSADIAASLGEFDRVAGT